MVNSCARETGIVELRGMIFSASPPIVSRPSDSGITSSSSQSSPRSRLPTSAFAWIAAPSATTSSGLRLMSGGWPKNSATARRTRGMRVAPPTRTTPFTSEGASFASRSARRTGCIVFCTSCCVMSPNVSIVSERLSSSPVDSRPTIGAAPCPVSISLASRAFTSSRRASEGDSGGSLAASSAQQKTRWSKSSPPSAESPLVASTSKTPRERRRMEMSNVPPPRS